MRSLEIEPKHENGPCDWESDGREQPTNGTMIEYLYLDFDTHLPYLKEKDEGSMEEKGQSTVEYLSMPEVHHLKSPFVWSKARKGFTLTVACLATVFASFAGSSYSPGVQQMTEEWNISRVAAMAGITSFLVGFAIAPMVLAPFSEINGRKPVFIATGVLYVVCTLCCGLTQVYSGMIVARFFAGAGSSTFSTMTGGLIADIYPSYKRNTPMAIFSGAAVFGVGLGPLVAGFIAQYTTWRWIFHIQVIVNGILVALITIFFHESRSHVILNRKADLLNEWYELREKSGIFGHHAPHGQGPTLKRIRWKVLVDQEYRGFGHILATSIYRPFQLFLTEPVVFFFSLWAAFSWSILYICLSVVPTIFETKYNFSLSSANSVLTASCIGAMLATVLGMYQEPIARRHNLIPDTPEGRLYFVCVEGFLLPIGLFLFGWTSAFTVHWIVPTIAIGMCSMGIYAIYLAVFNYLADVYGPYTSSSLAAQSFCRNVLAGAFPLVTRQMYNGMTIQGASSLLGGIAILLSFIPWALVFYGTQIRAKSRFANQVKQ